MSELRQGVRVLVERRSLSEERLRFLESMQGSACASASGWMRGRPHRAGLLAAALFLFLLIPGLTWWSSFPDREGMDLPGRVADEVAANHLELKPLEVETREIAGIRDYFAQLDFLPVDTRLPAIAGLELLGGRYCSIQGMTAAQLRLRSPGGAPLQTLYQVRYDPQRQGVIPRLGKGEPPLEIDARGLEVRLWMERGILFALVRE